MVDLDPWYTKVSILIFIGSTSLWKNCKLVSSGMKMNFSTLPFYTYEKRLFSCYQKIIHSLNSEDRVRLDSELSKR